MLALSSNKYYVLKLPLIYVSSNTIINALKFIYLAQFITFFHRYSIRHRISISEQSDKYNRDEEMIVFI